MKPIPFLLGEVSLVDDQIVCVTLLEDGEVDEQMIIQIIKATMELTKGGRHAIMLDFNDKNVPSTSLAKKLVAVRSEHESKVIGRALVSQSLPTLLEMNYFVQNFKPEVETRTFNSRQEGLEWLKLLVRKQKSN
jgi:hypothetical protein